MKRKRFQKDHILIKFMVSFFLALILPVFLFSFAFLKYDQKIYRDKLLEQEENSLEPLMQELEKNVEEMKQIALQTPLSSYLDKKDIQRYENTYKLVQLLARYRATHSFLKEIAAYYEDIPELIFTEKGTYSQEYYLQYDQNGKVVPLCEFMKTKKNGEWILPSEIAGKRDEAEDLLQYVFRTSDKNCWVFSVSEKRLNELLKQEGAFTVLYDENGRQLYPLQAEAEKKWEKQDGVLKLSIASRFGTLILVRYVDSSRVFHEAQRLRIYFLFCLVIVLVLGICLSTVLAFWNERPIWRLRAFCESKIKDIPRIDDSIEAVRFAVSQMDENIHILKQEKEKEHLMLQLLYGKQMDEQPFSSQLSQMNMFQKAERYVVFLISAVTGEDESFEIDRYIQLVMKQSEGEIYLMRCGLCNAIGIAGVDSAKAEKLSAEFEKMLAVYQDTSEEVVVYVCKPCKKLEEISRAYQAVLSESQNHPVEIPGSIVSVSIEPEQAFRYPELELSALYEATVNQDPEKITLIMEQLIESFPKQKETDFICMALYCDIIRTYRRALNKMPLHDEELRGLLNIERQPSPQSVPEMKTMISRILQKSMEYLKKQCPDGETEGEEVSEIFQYIRANREDPDLCVKTVALHFNLTVSNLSHRVKKLTGRNISDYITEVRMDYAHELLKNTDFSIQTISTMLGYSQASGFVTKFKKYYSVTPAEYRKKVKGDG